MKVLIEVDCETIADLHTHLQVLQKQIRKQCKINKSNPKEDDFAGGTEFYDDNCYGTHSASVYDE